MDKGINVYEIFIGDKTHKDFQRAKLTLTEEDRQINGTLLNDKPVSSDIKHLSNQDKHRMVKNLQSVEPADEGVGDNLTAAAEAARKVLSEVATPFKKGTQTAEEYVANKITIGQLLMGIAKEILEQLLKKYMVSELAIIPGLIQAAIEASKKGEE